LTKNTFSKIQGISIYITFGIADIIENIFLGDPNFSAQALTIENCYNIQILRTSIYNMTKLGAVKAFHDNKLQTILLLKKARR
jgi:hypothetical protein